MWKVGGLFEDGDPSQLLDIISAFCLLVSFAYFILSVRKISLEMHTEAITPGVFTLILRNVPPHVENVDAYRAFFRKVAPLRLHTPMH